MTINFTFFHKIKIILFPFVPSASCKEVYRGIIPHKIYSDFTLRYTALRAALRANGKKKLCVIIFVTHFITCQDQQVTTFISPRSHDFDVARKLAGWELIIHQPDNDNFYCSFALTGQISKSFRPERINQCLFGDDIIKREVDETEWRDIVTISGSRTENRKRKIDWLADYFGLPTDFKSAVHFRPRVNTFLIDADLFFGFNNIANGLYARIHVPLVYTNWNLNMTELPTSLGTNNHDPGYFNATGIPRDALLPSFTEFISGTSAPRVENLTFQPLKFAKMNPHALHIVRLASISAEIGYNFWSTNRFEGGFSLQATAPVGNRAKAEFLFEPLAGNGKHWELGAGFSSRIFAWKSESTDEQVDLHIELNVMHLFTSRQKRTFDLREKPNSRYMLAHKLDMPIENNLNGNGTVPIAQFKNEVTPIANITTFDVDVSVNLQAEFALMFSYTAQPFTFSFGYSCWKRGCEDIKIVNKSSFAQNTWAIKGDAHVYGFVGQAGDLALNTAVALSATQSKATINSGDNFPKGGVSTDQQERNTQIQAGRRNPRIDLPQPAFAGNQRLVASTNDTTQANQINTSIQPIFIQRDDIDIDSARTSGFANKIFTHFGKRWSHEFFSDTYLGLGTQVEFGRHAGPTPVIGGDECINCALSQWSILLKGGIHF